MPVPKKPAARPTIYHTRHESTDLNTEGTKDAKGGRLRSWHNIPLGEKGRADLPKLANFFTAHPIKHVVTADLERHMETGRAIAKKHGTTLTHSASFRPWDNASGAWKDRPLNKSLFKEMQWYVDHPEKPAPGGESFGNFDSRHKTGMDVLLAYALEHPDEHIALVDSTRGIGAGFAHITGDKSHISGRDIIAPGGVLKYEHDGTKWVPTVLRKDLGNMRKAKTGGKTDGE